MRKLLYLLLVCALAAGAVSFWLYRDWQQFTTRSVNPDSELILWLAPGSNFSSLVRQFETLGLASRSWHWRLYARLHGPSLRTGEYQIPANLRLDEIIARLESGRVREHRFTIVEGWTLARLRHELGHDPRVRPRSADWDEAELMARLGCEGCFGEGRFLPETYFFTRPADDLAILQRSYEAMGRELERIWAGRDAQLPLNSPEELLVLASIIERETGQAGERAEVAGVFVRRLNIGMRLQTDPTVIYGLDDDFDGRLRRVHLRTDHPWNTYTRHGLPPTPIALPGRLALEAAARPAPGTALYFVARGDGTHQFSDTLEQHNAAVNRYIRGRR
jgi:UPF0755 protein